MWGGKGGGRKKGGSFFSDDSKGGGKRASTSREKKKRGVGDTRGKKRRGRRLHWKKGALLSPFGERRKEGAARGRRKKSRHHAICVESGAAGGRAIYNNLRVTKNIKNPTQPSPRKIYLLSGGTQKKKGGKRWSFLHEKKGEEGTIYRRKP